MTGTRILAIDPGSAQSAWLLLTGGRPTAFGIEPNGEVVDRLRAAGSRMGYGETPDVLVIEQIESYGMAVGREVFETVWWAGRFAEAARPLPACRLPRRAVKLHLCGSARAKDANIRQALLDRFGGSAAVGRKSDPGPLYGVSKDVWAALAVAVTHHDSIDGGSR